MTARTSTHRMRDMRRRRRAKILVIEQVEVHASLVADMIECNYLSEVDAKDNDRVADALVALLRSMKRVKIK